MVAGKTGRIRRLGRSMGRPRGTPDVPSTALSKALKGYAQRLRRSDCRLLLVGVTADHRLALVGSPKP